MLIMLPVIILSLLAAGVIVLQIFLSKRQNKWLGLILPGISLFVSILVILGMLIFTVSTVEISGENRTVNLETGEIIVETIPVEVMQLNDSGSIIFSALYLFFLCNIPTIVLIGIYFACREKLRSKAALDKMTIQDLE